jgi:hypothetical protein
MTKKTTQETEAPDGRPRLDPRRRGFYLGPVLHEGFADLPKLSDDSRLLIARWAERFTPESLTEPQRDLLAVAPEPTVSLAQREFARNQRELRSPYLSVLFDSLSVDQQRAVQDPRRAGITDSGYPLSTPQLSRLVDATERQVRSWADVGLLPVYRESGERRFYSAAVIRAFALARAPGHSKAIAAAAARGEIGEHFQLLAATLAQVAGRMPLDLHERLIALAEDLSSSSRLMADISEDSELNELWRAAAEGSEGSRESDDEVFVAQERFEAIPMSQRSKTPVAAFHKKGSKPAMVVKHRADGIVVEVKMRHVGADGRSFSVSEADEIIGTRYGGKLGIDRCLIVTAPRGKDKWVNRLSGRKQALSVHETKQEAEAQGREVAREKGGKHVIYLRDGSISSSHRYD